MTDLKDFTKGPILKKLILFMLPILGALALQVFYGAVDMAIVGQFSTTEAAAGVSMGGQIVSYGTYMIAGMATAVTVFLGRYIGEKRRDEAGNVIGSSIFFFIFVTIVFTVVLCALARPVLKLINMPDEAMDEGIAYMAICGGGFIFVTAYNLVGAIFRGVGDSRTPLITVGIACVINIVGDLILVKGVGMGAAGAAIATIFAQAVSVVISVIITVVRAKKGVLPFEFSKKNIRPHWRLMGKIIKVAIPLAFNELILGVSFMILSAILNNLGVVASAAVGVAGKLANFIMIFTSAFSQAIAAFVAQNIGANDLKRARRSWLYAVAIACAFGAIMLVLMFFWGEWFTAIFNSDHDVIVAAADFTKAYAVDTVFSAAMFCTCGYLNGCGKSNITLIQCIIGVAVRVPMAFWLMNAGGGSMFITGLCIPISTVCQLIFLLIYLGITNKKMDKTIKQI